MPMRPASRAANSSTPASLLPRKAHPLRWHATLVRTVGLVRLHASTARRARSLGQRARRAARWLARGLKLRLTGHRASRPVPRASSPAAGRASARSARLAPLAPRALPPARRVQRATRAVREARARASHVPLVPPRVPAQVPVSSAARARTSPTRASRAVCWPTKEVSSKVQAHRPSRSAPRARYPARVRRSAICASRGPSRPNAVPRPASSRPPEATWRLPEPRRRFLARPARFPAPPNLPARNAKQGDTRVPETRHASSRSRGVSSRRLARRARPGAQPASTPAPQPQVASIVALGA